jgi:hypothetical protein
MTEGREIRSLFAAIRDILSPGIQEQPAIEFLTRTP